MLINPKFLTSCGIALAAVLGVAASPVRKTDISGPSVPVKEIRLIAAPGNKMAEFAAEEALRLLKRAGNQVEKSETVKPGILNVVIGKHPDFPETREDLSSFPDGAFRILRSGDRVFIFGIDTPTADPFKQSAPMAFGYRKGSLYGTYDFLERFAGVRFYFPGEMGTLVAKGKLKLPGKIDLLDFPDWEERSYMPWERRSGKWWYPGSQEYKRFPPGTLLNTLRFRANTIAPNMSNALNWGEYLNRFYKTHPDYFAMSSNGKRIPEVRNRWKCQFCLKSGIEEEIYQDIKAYFEGKPASSRGMKAWPRNMFSPRGVNMTHDDAFVWCECPQCRKIALNSQRLTDPAARQRISNEVWNFTCRIARRLKKENVPNARLIMLAYNPYDVVPECEIPDNVLPVVVVFPGIQGDCGALQRNDRLLKAWKDKCKGKLLVRAWPGKYLLRDIPDIPNMHHNLLRDYLKKRHDWFSGGYIDEGTDRHIFRHLNLYLFFKYAWNNHCDLQAEMDEYFRLMFGKGAPFIREYYDAMEKIWDRELIKDTVNSDIGGKAEIASVQEQWTTIFSDERIKQFDSLFDRALAAAKGDPESIARIKFMRREIYEPLRKRKMDFAKEQNAMDNWNIYPGDTVWLRPRKDGVAEVITKFKLTESPDAFQIEFTCEEPLMKSIRARASEDGTGKVWEDSDVEIFFNPSGDRKHFLQWCINSNGAMDCVVSGKDALKENNATVQVSKGDQSWHGTLTIPKKSLGEYRKEGFPVLLARHRVLEPPAAKPKEEHYCWLAWSNPPSFLLPEYWGSLCLTKKTSKNLVENGDFQGFAENEKELRKQRKFYRSFRDKNQQKITFDTRCFVSGGQSILLESNCRKSMDFQLVFSGMEPGRKYRLSFFCRLENVQGEGLDAYITGFGKAIHPMRLNRQKGTHPWHVLSFVITTPPEKTSDRQIVAFACRNATGKIWVDNVRIEPIE